MQLTCHGLQERYKDLRDFYVDNPPFKNYQNSEKKKKDWKNVFLAVSYSDCENPWRRKTGQEFFSEGMKASHFYSFGNPWSLTLNFNQEKLYLINNGICWLDEELDQYWSWQPVLAAVACRNMLVVVLKNYVSSSPCASFSWSFAWELVSKDTSRS